MQGSNPPPPICKPAETGPKGVGYNLYQLAVSHQNVLWSNRSLATPAPLQVVALVVVLANRTLKRLQPRQGGVLVDIALEGDVGEEAVAAGSTQRRAQAWYYGGP